MVYWKGNSAFIDAGDQVWKVGYRTDTGVRVTPDAARFGLTDASLANTSASEVQSQEPKKRGRKAKVAEVPDPDLLDELEI